MPKEPKHSFRTTILQTGNNTGICVPEEIVENFGAGKRLPVIVKINDYTYPNTIAVMSGKYMISVSADIRSKAGIQGGDKVNVELQLDTKPREVTLPADFKKALAQNRTAKVFYESLAVSYKKKYVSLIEDAKTSETRTRRIEKAVKDLSEQKK